MTMGHVKSLVVLRDRAVREAGVAARERKASATVDAERCGAVTALAERYSHDAWKNDEGQRLEVCPSAWVSRKPDYSCLRPPHSVYAFALHV